MVHGTLTQALRRSVEPGAGRSPGEHQNGKRDRLPSAGALEAAGDAIAAWWMAAYLRPDDAVLPKRFAIEARASLPGLASEATPRPEDVQNARALQRMRLRQDQGVPEWSWR